MKAVTAFNEACDRILCYRSSEAAAGSKRVRFADAAGRELPPLSPRGAGAPPLGPLAALYVMAAATVRDGGCNRMLWRLQLYVMAVAAVYDGACNPMWWRLQPYVICDGGCSPM